jgi:hypothetical protein
VIGNENPSHNIFIIPKEKSCESVALSGAMEAFHCAS